MGFGLCAAAQPQQMTVSIKMILIIVFLSPGAWATHCDEGLRWCVPVFRRFFDLLRAFHAAITIGAHFPQIGAMLCTSRKVL